MQKVAGEVFPGEAACLEDFARYLVKGAVYPAIVAKSGKKTCGMLFHGLSVKHMRLLDDYEGRLYSRQSCEVVTQQNERVKAQVYVLASQFRYMLSSQAWEKEEFIRKHYDAYLAAI